jgi:hypothetical protein
MTYQNLTDITRAGLFALTGFMAAWQASDFGMDPNHILGALTAALVGWASPRAAGATTGESES